MTTDPALPRRHGDRPRTTPTNPHEQLEQNAPPELQEDLWAWMHALPQTQAHPSEIGPRGTRALSLDADPPGGARPLMIGREFVHLHPRYDGSLHAVLAPSDADAAIAAGWAERHPLAGRFAPSSTVMLYGPRDAGELAIVQQLVGLAHAYARGTRS